MSSRRAMLVVEGRRASRSEGPALRKLKKEEP
jgi:hypothetical protein